MKRYLSYKYVEACGIDAEASEVCFKVTEILNSFIDSIASGYSPQTLFHYNKCMKTLFDDIVERIQSGEEYNPDDPEDLILHEAVNDPHDAISMSRSKISIHTAARQTLLKYLSGKKIKKCKWLNSQLKSK